MPRRLLLLAGLVGLLAPAARADVKPHPLFTDNMVIQRGVACPVWGTADPGEQVTVTFVAGGGKVKVSSTPVTADDQGRWQAAINPSVTGAVWENNSHELVIKGKNTITLKNVALGDVWLCSGQSNMEWKVSQLTKDDQGKKVAAGAKNPDIRLFTVPNRPAAEPQTTFPQTDKEGRWLECTPETVLNFSAVGYFFGRDIQKAQKVPVGLIASDWGGTPAEAWTSKEGLNAVESLRYYHENLAKRMAGYDAAKADAQYKEALAKYQEAAAKAKEEGKPPPRPPVKDNPLNQNSPSALYNGMIAPLLPFPIRGAIWYQGESNAGRAKEYRVLMPTLITDWRRHWGAELPFFMVQLAPFRGGASGVDYAELRDAQFNTARTLPKVGIAVITDAGDETDIHPQKKEPAGVRLALAARAIAYGEPVEFSGPVFRAMRTELDRAILTFDHVDGGLVCKGDELHGFTVCGEDKVFHPAKAEIKGDTVVVTCDKVSKPVAVRFGWVNFPKPELNFFNKAGLPAVPFRTDDFPLTTK